MFNVLGNPAMSVETTRHYSWNYAQVHYPQHAQQVGPIYLKKPRKCNIFGVCSEGSGNYFFSFTYETCLLKFMYMV